jgi:uncharacterized protein (DUF433 family)
MACSHRPGNIPLVAERPPNTPRPVSQEDLQGDEVRPGSPLYGVVWANPERMSGTPCFYGTRVPIKNLFDYLRTGHTLDEFVADFPGVTRKQVETILAQ